MELKFYFYFVLLCVCARGDLCPKQCDCDMENGLNRAMCVGQNIIDVEVGVPKAVQVYSLSHNVISELDNFCFKELGYTSIHVLILSYNLIFWIGLHAFAGLDDLTHLDLSSNRLRYISSDLFWDTPALDTLDLSSNVFEALNNEPFIMHDKLQILNLHNCRIKSIPERLFTRLPNLKKLDLSENYMNTMNTEMLRPLHKLERIELRNDYWQCTQDFMDIENWILLQGIQYIKQCRKKIPKMSEKMISVVEEDKEPIDVNSVWNVTIDKNDTLPALQPTKNLTAFEKFDKNFSSFQAFVIGLEVGLAVGIVGTYIWLRKFCKCGQLSCTRPQSRRERRRVWRAESDMRTLLWSSVLNPDLETPPSFRRQFPLPDRSTRFPTYGLPSVVTADLQVDAVHLPDRSETPPPPYNECRINI